MSACEQELCPFWAGDGGCPCDVLDIGEDERRAQRRAMGMFESDEDELTENESEDVS